ncbi:MAG: zinc ribbon domain-containing protein [Spirochaetota bacterium]
MQDVIEKLKTLQDILSERYRIEQELKNIPKSLSTKTELLTRLKRQYIEKNEEYEQTRTRIRDIKARMDEAERDREHYEQQMAEIKTQREYEALDKEIREAGEREQQLRKELQREERILEEMKHSLEREELMISEQEKELEDEQSRIESESESKRTQIDALKSEADVVTPGMDENLLFKFDRIIRSQEGEGIVPLRKGVCSGCNMILPRQFVNDVRSAESIHFCPYCSKIVFYVEDDQASPDDDAEGLMDVLDEDSTGGLADLIDEDDAFTDEEELIDDLDSPLAARDEDEEDEEDEDEDEEAGLVADDEDEVDEDDDTDVDEVDADEEDELEEEDEEEEED